MIKKNCPDPILHRRMLGCTCVLGVRNAILGAPTDKRVGVTGSNPSGGGS